MKHWQGKYWVTKMNFGELLNVVLIIINLIFSIVAITPIGKSWDLKHNALFAWCMALIWCLAYIYKW